MLFLYSKIIDANVFELKNLTKVGKVYEVIIQKENLALAGFVLENRSFLFRQTEVISTVDICEIANKNTAIIITDEDVITKLDDAIRLKQAVDEGYYGVGQKVVTKSGKTVGKVYDFVVASDTYAIKSLYVKNIFSDKIISTKNVIDFNKRRIVIKDDLSAKQLTSPAIGSSVI